MENYAYTYRLVITGRLNNAEKDITYTILSNIENISFEQAWKAMKEILGNNGYAERATGSPKTILKTAFSAGMITDEALWLDALVSRNNVAYAYNQDIAMDIINRTKECYYDMFVELSEMIEKNWV